MSGSTGKQGKQPKKIEAVKEDDYENDQYDDDFEKEQPEADKKKLTRTTDNQAKFKASDSKHSEGYSEEERDKVPAGVRQLEEKSNRDEYSEDGDDEEKVNIDENQMLDIAEYIFNTIA